MIEVRDLYKRFHAHVALEAVDFTVPKGEIFGFVGPNGAGKTTTIRILATLVTPDSGTVFVGGIPVTHDPHAVRELVGYLPDFFGVYDSLTCVEYLEFYASCGGVPRRRRRATALELLELVDMQDGADDEVNTLNRGMKQRLGLARALVHDPQVPCWTSQPRALTRERD